MKDGDSIWPAYYAQISGRQPWPLVTRATALFETESASPTPRSAVDLGCGDGTETLVLIRAGWQVLAIDAEPEAMRLTEEKVPAERRQQLNMQRAAFQDAVLGSEVDLVLAQLSLPFCEPEHFPGVWQKIVKALRPGGRFAGHFFGDRDTWAALPHMTCLPRPDVEALLVPFEIERFEEIENDRPTALGEPHHWHVFEVIARKRDV
jgi:tellurite methyltransferase